MHGNTNKSPIKISEAEIKFDTGDSFTNGKNSRGKTPPGEFKVTTPENPLLSKQAITSKGIPVANDRTYVFHLLRTYVILLCNWLIF